jgi:hypothetical protein
MGVVKKGYGFIQGTNAPIDTVTRGGLGDHPAGNVSKKVQQGAVGKKR